MYTENFVVVATLYKFVNLPDFRELRSPLLSFCQERGIKGTILLAQEGINGTVAGSCESINAVLDFLRFDSRFTGLDHKESYTNKLPFARMKVKLKKEIVTLGIPEINPNEKVGIYVKPKQWNEIISDPDVTVIDTRNDYEVNIGSFKGAENPKTQSFRDFPEYVQKNLDPKKHKKVAMFCTGGIRCEKASAYMINQGFEEVYHLEGGILKYLEEIPTEESLWEGECFVFDERVAVVHGLELGHYELCFGCGHPIDDMEKSSPRYEEGICCSHCFDNLTEEKRLRQQEKWKQYKLLCDSL
ncbi:rhodanese-related sulfurtransferase [Anabaena sp. FACHB-1237]|uniref:oxygen-dependent tRNA uridine(34) hydroxylase TrhO n=1 Tax=Anabaena sp. FACHB-1237 TaxID=2692769 RepID=UPI00168016F5|nr:rhodanese-related sulfurtransferase [Anabaena sp. FACHB-1237]MBD2137535.1 rhodanese-related sulfurtransferase [Anabaena sp. FACHB-1237]